MLMLKSSLARIFFAGLAVGFACATVAQDSYFGADGTLFPPTPKAFEQVWVKFVCIDLERCAGGAVSATGNTLTVIRYQAPCLNCNYPVTVFVELGRLPAGTYTVRVVNASGNLRSTQQLTISDPNPPGPYALSTLAFAMGNYTDQWWDPAEPGWGIAITQHVSGALFAVWAVYGPDANPVWYTLQSGSWTSYNTYSGQVIRTTGPYFGGSYANGPTPGEAQVGNATLTFSDPANGTLQFNVGVFSATKAISRLPY
jgi:hypothetical protein